MNTINNEQLNIILKKKKKEEKKVILQLCLIISSLSLLQFWVKQDLLPRVTFLLVES